MGADRIILDVNSPGGYVDGLYSTMNVIENIPVPVSARVGGMAASAAYMLASMANDISAENELSMIGSVGVATSASVNKYSKEIANTDSPKKRPDVSTADGEAAVREELDDVYSVIVERIAKGRGTTVDTVNMMYGQGAVMTARKAVQRGMIDKVGFENTDSASAKTKGMNMDTEQTPVAEAVATVDGAAVERERIKGIESLVSEFSGSHPAVLSAVRAEIDSLKFSADVTRESAAVALLPVVAKANAESLASLAASRVDANKAAETTAAAVPDLTGKESAAKESAARAQGLAAEVEGAKK
jgi:ClpP class serine protease